MALPNASLVKTALENLYAAIGEDKTQVGTRPALAALNSFQFFLNSQYPTTTITVVDEADAGVSEWVTADADVFVGAIIKMGVATADLTDNALATAKGSAVAAGDVYVISGADAVVYLGDVVAFDFDGEAPADFEA